MNDKPSAIRPTTVLLAVVFLCAAGLAARQTILLSRAAREIEAARASRPVIADFAPGGLLPGVPGLSAILPQGRPGRIEAAVLDAEASGDPTQLERTLAALVEEQDDPWARVELGALEIRRRGWARARDLLFPALEVPETSEKATFLLFLASEGLGLPEASRQALALLSARAQPGRWALLGRAIEAARAPAAGVEDVERAFGIAVRVRPAGADGAWAHLFRADWLESIDRPDAARFDLAAARALDALAALPGKETGR